MITYKKILTKNFGTYMPKLRNRGDIMKIAIVGVGAIGGIYAALLAKAGEEPLLIDNDSQKLKVISKKGLTVEGWGSFDLPIVDTPPQAEQDLLIIATKTYLNDAVYPSLRPMLGQNTTIFTLQNGFGNGEALAELYPSEQICVGSTYWGAICAEAGLVLPKGKGLTVVAPWLKAEPERAQDLSDFLNNCDIIAEFEEDALSMLWHKLVLNSIANPLSAVYRIKNGEILTNPQVFKLAKALLREGVMVANAYGNDFTLEEMSALSFGTLKEVAENQTSMLRDKLAGRPLEIDSITGAIVKLAHAKGLKVPVNEKMLAALQ